MHKEPDAPRSSQRANWSWWRHLRREAKRILHKSIRRSVKEGLKVDKGEFCHGKDDNRSCKEKGGVV